jgi:hypothetical protein
MATLLQSYNGLYPYDDPSSIRKRVTAGCVAVAALIDAESVETTNHTNRATWADAVDTNAKTEALDFMPYLHTSQLNDDDLLVRISELVDEMNPPEEE